MVKSEEGALRQVRGSRMRNEAPPPKTRGIQTDFQHSLNFASFICPEFVLQFKNPLALMIAYTGMSLLAPALEHLQECLSVKAAVI